MENAVYVLGERIPLRSIPPPSALEWDILCHWVGIQSQHDLSETLSVAKSALNNEHYPLFWLKHEREVPKNLAGLTNPTLHNLMEFSHADNEKCLRLDRRARRLALRGPKESLGESVPPSNTPRDLQFLPRLIEWNTAIVSRWYVRRLLDHLAFWAASDNRELQHEAKAICKKIGRAFNPPLPSGRPSDRSMRIKKAVEILQTYESAWDTLKQVWEKYSRSEDRYRELATAFGEQFAPVMGDPGYRGRKPDREVAKEITLRTHGVGSEITLRRRLALARKVRRQQH